MMRLHVIIQLIISLVIVENCNSISSPLSTFTTYKHAIELQANRADLWWTMNDNNQEITFELHIKTTGWIALGISPAGGMKGADIGVGWVDQTGRVHFQDRYAYANSRPIIDNTTTDWYALRGREANGWTAIQFKRLLDTCDTMDVEIKSGTNILIYAYGLVDPDGDISYHENRRGSRMIPLRSYANPTSEDKFDKLEHFEFRLHNYVVPPTDTTYYCKVYKAANGFPGKRHAIAHKTLVDSANRDLVHHLVLYECDSSAKFDDNKLPEGVCDEFYGQAPLCSSNIAIAWAVGGDEIVEFPKEAGYPVGDEFPIKYYMLQMHYDNSNLTANRTDSSGIRFYIGKELRQYDIGYLTLGTEPDAVALAIPPKVDRFIVDTYCPAEATRNFPASGIMVVSAFPHTHLQGLSVRTKLIRNKAVVQDLFNAEAYDFNYQFVNQLPTPIKLYPGDEFATRCVYNTMNKNEITLGGERTKDEMCSHMFAYYPRMNNFYGCYMSNSVEAWKTMMNSSSTNFDEDKFKDWLLNQKWTPERVIQWQNFYNNASRKLMYGEAANLQFENFAGLPTYKDLTPEKCRKNSAIREHAFVLLILMPIVMKTIGSK
ncbi:unnamed protein product [Adineta ricciae]|uniref:DOMON domain-containing protein n=1 Tax=Adineta ricciae TaxID=249248 RepID=A0A815LYU6_ADIRI|nr:unnamed protein product [Adineta ricciae]CAF1416297.1 unnamed protein product [Adineta ricciae]